MLSLTRHAGLIATTIVAIAAGRAWAAGGVPPSAKAMGASAEIQIGLCASVDHIVHALDLKLRGAPIMVWQFDDDALTLLQHGVRLRLRVTADGRSEFALKAAAQDCADLDPKRVAQGEGKCEYDIYAANTTGTVSLTRKLDVKSTNQLLASDAAPTQALSPSQARYLRRVVHFWPLPREIRKLGPMRVQRYRTKGNRYDVDVSHLPDDEQYAEISRKVPLADATRMMGVLEDDLRKAGVAMCNEQSSPAASKLRALVR